MAESMSMLRNPRRPEPKAFAKGKESEGAHVAEGDHMHSAVEAMHAAEPHSKHMAISHDGFGMKSHGIDESGQHDGPHDHENIEELKSHLGKFFNEEEGEGHDGGEEPEENQSIY